MRLALLIAIPLLGVTLGTSAHACINDRDSDALALQAGRVPDAVRIISGRFERNPPQYYQMRLEHAQKVLWLCLAALRLMRRRRAA